MTEEALFNDILLPRRSERSIFKFMSREWIPQKAYVVPKTCSPQDLKDLVAKSVYLDSVIEAESQRTGVRKEKLYQDAIEYLEEIGLDKKMYVVRWTGIVFLKLSFMMNVGIYVNENAILKLKSTMGGNPVLFLPTHRSYADFCLMTYICYHYDIELPAVAAGTDFYSMAVVGRRLRETCAFYIRRTLDGAPLYAATLRQYVRALVSRYSAPVEFFLEGTRCRTNKSRAPKYGMLSMALMPYFAREVSDVTIIPVNISYDRIMETTVFAYEHLGVPKPKESTGGLFKAIRGLNGHFGNVYLNFGSPLSLHEYLHTDSNSDEMLKPVDLQQLTPEQFSQVQDIANEVVSLQQKCTVATISNLLALVLMQSLIENKLLNFEEVVQETDWMIKVLKSLGASVFEVDVRKSVERILVVHSNMMAIDKENHLRLVSSAPMTVSDDIKKKMKGHTLSAETMVTAVPVIQLQIYVNPVLHYLVPPALVYLIASTGTTREKLKEDYSLLRTLLKHEFFHVDKDEDTTFNKAVKFCIDNDVVSEENGRYSRGGELKTQQLLRWTAWPALDTLLTCADVMIENTVCSMSSLSKLSQARSELRNQHPYCLSLEAIAAVTQGLAQAKALTRERGTSETTYRVVPDQMQRCRTLVAAILPQIQVDFGKLNDVILDHRTTSKL